MMSFVSIGTKPMQIPITINKHILIENSLENIFLELSADANNFML